MTDKICIIGGGIAGLYSALQLLDQGFSNIHVYEATNRLGGHIYTHYDKTFQFETGGIRFNKYHTRLMKLLDRFGLTTVELPKEKQFIRVLCNKRFVSHDLSEEFIKKVIQASKKYSKEALLNMTFGQLCDDILGLQNSHLTISSFGYNAEFHVANAYQSLEIFKRDFVSDAKYYACIEGLSELVNRIEKELESKGIKIYKNYGLKDFSYEKSKFKIAFQNKETDICDRIVLAVPKGSLIHLNFFTEEQKQLLNSVSGIPLHRIFGQFSKPWFKKIVRTTTDIPLRHFIPIDYTQGIAQISYSDLYDADYWKHHADQGLDVLEKQLHMHLALLFPKHKIPPLQWLLSYYWKEGVHVWNVGSEANVIRKRLQSIHPKLYIVGESYSLHHGWIEGALESVDAMLLLKGGNHNYKHDLETLSKITLNDLENAKQKYPNFKWVLLKLKGDKQHRIVDVTDWMNIHPGGVTPFTDHMYQDITKYFNSVGFHYDQGAVKNHVFENVKKYTLGYIKI